MFNSVYNKKNKPIDMNFVIGILFSYFLYSSIVFKRYRSKTIMILESKPVEYLGRISYSLYLVHGPFLALANIYMLKNYTFSDDVRQLLLFAFVLFFIIPFSALFYHLIEKRFLNK
ncbi:acyltransferase family protein [Sphingobacterium siyangense]|uniref:acyltransferase family protein n=1 Tax=Sphingobacterium siyangense TaxID=459529 RepID=UPI003DA33A07